MFRKNVSAMRIVLGVAAIGLLWVNTGQSQRITDDLVVLWDFTDGAGSVVHDRGPSLGVPGNPVDLMFDPAELSQDPNAGQFGDRPGLISWGDSWININKDHPADDGTAHGTPDAAVIWDGGPGNSSKIVDMIEPTGEFTIEAWVRPETIENRSNSGRIFWMTVEGTSDASNFVIGQDSCCDGPASPGGIQLRLNTDSADTADRVIFDTDSFLFDDEDLVHIVHTHSTLDEETVLYVNVEGDGFDTSPALEEFVPGADLSGWDPDYVVALANDPYRFSRWFGGEIHLVAMYSRAFTSEEVEAHYDLGPATGSSVVGDFNDNGMLDAPDIDDLTVQSALGTNDSTYDLNNDTLVNSDDIEFWIKNLFNSWVGDANLDNEFNSTDLTSLLASGAYESGNPSTWSQGDFNGDGFTDSGDLVFGLADGGYEQGPPGVSAVPEPSALCMTLLAAIGGLLAVRNRPSGV